MENRKPAMIAKLKGMRIKLNNYSKFSWGRANKEPKKQSSKKNEVK